MITRLVTMIVADARGRVDPYDYPVLAGWVERNQEAFSEFNAMLAEAATKGAASCGLIGMSLLFLGFLGGVVVMACLG